MIKAIPSFWTMDETHLPTCFQTAFSSSVTGIVFPQPSRGTQSSWTVTAFRPEATAQAVTALV